MRAEKSILATGFGDGKRIVGLQCGGEGSVEFDYRSGGGLRIVGELLESGIGEAVGIESVDGERGVRWVRGLRLRWVQGCEEDGLSRGIEGEGIGGVGELEVVQRAVKSLVCEARVGHPVQHGETVGEDGFGI